MQETLIDKKRRLAEEARRRNQGRSSYSPVGRNNDFRIDPGSYDPGSYDTGSCGDAGGVSGGSCD